MKQGSTYIMSNHNRTTLYIGATNNIYRRVWEHKTGRSNFTSRYRLYHLLHCEDFFYIGAAVEREKQLKRWHRQWKWNLIKSKNPELIDLSQNWFTEEQLQAAAFDMDWITYG